jgi:hypothetical protein
MGTVSEFSATIGKSPTDRASLSLVVVRLEGLVIIGSRIRVPGCHALLDCTTYKISYDTHDDLMSLGDAECTTLASVLI